MAVVTEVTISTGNTVGIGGQACEVGIALTYRLEREDGDVMQVVRDKAAEVARAHQAAWKSIRDEQAPLHSRASSKTSAEAAPPQDAPVPAEEEESEPATETQIKALDALVRASPLGEDQFEALLRERFGCTRTSELSRPQAGGLLVELQRGERERLARRRSESRSGNGQAAPARSS